MEVPLFAVVLVGVGYVAAALRRGRAAAATRSHRVRSLRVSADPALVFERLRHPFGRYRVDDVDAEARQIVLSIPPSPLTWGFFFPIWIAPDLAGGSIVEVDVRSKLVQWGPLVTHAHHRCVDAIEALLVQPPPARVVT